MTPVSSLGPQQNILAAVSSLKISWRGDLPITHAYASTQNLGS